MRLTEMLGTLQQLRTRYGDIEVYFDCPKCHVSFTPDRVVTEEVHFTQADTGRGQAAPEQDPAPEGTRADARGAALHGVVRTPR